MFWDFKMHNHNQMYPTIILILYLFYAPLLWHKPKRGSTEVTTPSPFFHRDSQTWEQFSSELMIQCFSCTNKTYDVRYVWTPFWISDTMNYIRTFSSDVWSIYKHWAISVTRSGDENRVHRKTWHLPFYRVEGGLRPHKTSIWSIAQADWDSPDWEEDQRRPRSSGWDQRRTRGDDRVFSHQGGADQAPRPGRRGGGGWVKLHQHREPAPDWLLMKDWYAKPLRATRSYDSANMFNYGNNTPVCCMNVYMWITS